MNDDEYDIETELREQRTLQQKDTEDGNESISDEENNDDQKITKSQKLPMAVKLFPRKEQQRRKV